MIDLLNTIKLMDMWHYIFIVSIIVTLIGMVISTTAFLIITRKKTITVANLRRLSNGVDWLSVGIGMVSVSSFACEYLLLGFITFVTSLFFAQVTRSLYQKSQDEDAIKSLQESIYG